MTKKVVKEYKTKPVLNPIEAATDKEWLEKWSENIKPLAERLRKMGEISRQRNIERETAKNK